MVFNFMLLVFGFIMGFIFKAILKGLLEDDLVKFGRTIKQKIGWILKKFSEPKTSEFFSIGSYKTSLYILDGNGKIKYKSNTLNAIYTDGSPDSPDDIADRILRHEQDMEAQREAGNQKIWDGIGVGIRELTILRDKDEKNLEMVISFYKTRYAAFRATVAEVSKEDRSDENSIFKKHIDGSDPLKPISYLARHVGVTALILTSDKKIIMTKRSHQTSIRRGEYDVSVVEGIEPTKDVYSDGVINKIDIFRSIKRGCDEELGFEPADEEISILGFGVDMKFYQYNFISIIETKLSLSQIANHKNGRAKDGWENKIHAINFDIDEVLSYINRNSMWGFATVSLYWLLIKHFTQFVVDKSAQEIVTKTQ